MAVMPQGDAPDTLLKGGGPAGVQEAVKASLGPIENKLRVLSRSRSHDDDDYWAEAVDILAQAGSPAELDRHIAQIAPFYPWQRNSSRAQATLRNQVLAKRGRDS